MSTTPKYAAYHASGGIGLKRMVSTAPRSLPTNDLLEWVCIVPFLRSVICPSQVDASRWRFMLLMRSAPSCNGMTQKQNTGRGMAVSTTATSSPTLIFLMLVGSRLGHCHIVFPSSGSVRLVSKLNTSASRRPQRPRSPCRGKRNFTSSPMVSL